MMATHDWLTSRRLISININYQLIIYLKLYINCNTINMIISLIVKIIRYCLSLRQLEVDFWQGHHQYPCCSQRCTLNIESFSNILHQIQNLLSSYLLSPAPFRREDWTQAQEAVLWPRLQRLQGLQGLQGVPGAGRWVLPQVCVHWSHFCIRPLSDCQLRLRRGDVAASTDQDRLSPARTSHQ